MMSKSSAGYKANNLVMDSFKDLKMQLKKDSEEDGNAELIS